MTEVGSRVSTAHGTSTRFVERARVVRPLCVLDVQLAARRESLACSTVPRRQNAIKHVNAPRNCLDEIFGRADTHQVSRRVFRHFRDDLFYHIKHHRLLFADAQSADGVAVKANVYGLFETDSSQISMAGALHDSKQGLRTAQTFGLTTPSVCAFRLQLIERDS